MFFLISAHFTATLGVPSTPARPLARQFPSPSRGWAPDFDEGLGGPPAGALRPMIPDNARIPRITAAAGTELADAYSPGTVLRRPREKEFTNHSPSSPTRCRSVRLRAHCGIFPTAASHRSLGRISVPVWLTTLSSQLLIVALLGHYPNS